MTAGTGRTLDPAVVEIDQSPVVGDVAGIAALCGPDVTTVFTCRRGAVMTAFTGAHHGLVINPRNPLPTECRMTKLTGIVCPDMRG